MAGHFTKSGTHIGLEVALGGLVWASDTTGLGFLSTKFVLRLSIHFMQIKHKYVTSF